MTWRIPHILLLFFLVMFVGCDSGKQLQVLQHVEDIIEVAPDSALTILRKIPTAELKGDKEKAQYALLMSMALDKNYIDTPTFDIIRPALDYYLKKGTPDQKLRTYYYQSRIYENQGDVDNALNYLVRALDLAPECSDSAVLGRAYINQGCLLYHYHDYEGYIQSYLKAAKIFHELGDVEAEIDCNNNLIHGSRMIRNRNLADSAFKIITNLYDYSGTYKYSIIANEVYYAML